MSPTAVIRHAAAVMREQPLLGKRMRARLPVISADPKLNFK